MNIKPLVAYSDPDAAAPHVEMADEAVHIGAAPSKSYLLGDVIIQAALVGAVLSGLWFHPMQVLSKRFKNRAYWPGCARYPCHGDKIESSTGTISRRILRAGNHGAVSDADEAGGGGLYRLSGDGQASAGGGGKGMGSP